MFSRLTAWLETKIRIDVYLHLLTLEIIVPIWKLKASILKEHQINRFAFNSSISCEDVFVLYRSSK